MPDNLMPTFIKLREYHSKALTKINRQILDLEREQNENLAAKTGVSASPALPLHSEVEYPDKGTPATKRRTRR